MDSQRKLLEKLMGKAALSGGPDTLDYKDYKVCKSYLCGLCPCDLFGNTKMDIGDCNKTHSDKLKKEYQDAYDKGLANYEQEWLNTMNEFIDDCDKRIKIAQQKLEKSPEDRKMGELVEEIADLKNEITTLNSQVESLGDEGKVSEALTALKKAEELFTTKVSKEAELVALTAETNTKLRVCDVCSAYLSVYDSDRRLADHFNGKMHLGFMMIREQVAKLLEKQELQDDRQTERKS